MVRSTDQKYLTDTRSIYIYIQRNREKERESIVRYPGLSDKKLSMAKGERSWNSELIYWGLQQFVWRGCHQAGRALFVKRTLTFLFVLLLEGLVCCELILLNLDYDIPPVTRVIFIYHHLHLFILSNYDELGSETAERWLRHIWELKSADWNPCELFGRFAGLSAAN
jgi:hypothetical protein